MNWGRLGGSVSWASSFGSGHDLMVCRFEPCIGLYADSSEPGACSDSVSLFLCPSPARSRVLSFSLKNKQTLKKNFFLNIQSRGVWVAQSVERPTSAQVMISQLVSSSPASGYVLTSQSLESASASVTPSLSAPLPLTLSLSLKRNK